MQYAVQDMPVELDLGEIQTKAFEEGGIYARHISLPAGTDFRPLLAGLPGDVCSCPHWGQVLEGSITIRYSDGTQETSSAGDVYSWPAGHVGWTDTGVVFLELSPTQQILPVLEHLGAQLQPS